MRSSPAFLAVCLLLLLPACAARKAGISGEVKGTEGTLPYAQVFLTQPNEKIAKPLRSSEVQPDGSFWLEVPGPGDYLLWLAAPGYPAQSLFIPVTPEEPAVSLQATLAPYRYVERFEKPSVIGSWNDYAMGAAEPMVPQPDGSWLFEREVPGDSVTYQLTEVVADGSTVPGTQAEGYVIDSGGDYQCKVRTQEGRVRIRFEPAKLPRKGEGAPLHAVFEAPHEELGPLNALHAEAAHRGQEAQQAFVARRGNPKVRSFDYGDFPKKLLAIARDSSKSVLTRQVAALDLLGLPFYEPATYHPGAEGEALAAELFQLLPIDSPRWVLSPHGPPRLVGLTAEASQPGLLRQFADRNPEPKVRAGALVALLMRAQKAEDTAQVAALSEELKPYAQGNPLVRMMLSSTRTDLKVTKGQPAPSFSAELLGGQGTVSRESLAGRFYLVDFWAVWCAPCVEEIPRLHTAFERFQGRGGFTILSVSLDRSVEQVRQFREKWKMPWLNVFAGASFESPLPKAFEVQSIPSAVLVDAQGRIVAKDMELRGEQLERTLDALLPAK